MRGLRISGTRLGLALFLLATILPLSDVQFSEFNVRRRETSRQAC